MSPFHSSNSFLCLCLCFDPFCPRLISYMCFIGLCTEHTFMSLWQNAWQYTFKEMPFFWAHRLRRFQSITVRKAWCSHFVHGCRIGGSGSSQRQWGWDMRSKAFWPHFPPLDPTLIKAPQILLPRDYLQLASKWSECEFVGGSFQIHSIVFCPWPAWVYGNLQM